MLKKIISHSFPSQNTCSWIELSQKALENNVSFFRQYMPTESLLAFVVKANAYGHGLQEIVIMAEKIATLDWLCVFSLSEALSARSFGCTKPILVLGYIDADPSLALFNKISFMIDTIEHLTLLNKIGIKNRSRFTIHLKIDTGLSRFGIAPQKIISFALIARKSPGILLEGIFSHLSESQIKQSTFTHKQINNFNNVVLHLKKNDLPVLHIHITNTAALLNVSHNASYNYNFFRVGLGLYGFFPPCFVLQKQDQSALSLEPILSWKTSILSIKKITAGSYIGYNRTHITQKDTTIALIPVGYSSGLPVALSNKAHVLINNTLVPLVGKIAMNISVVDISIVPTAKIGDTVTLIGSHNAIKADYYSDNLEGENVRTFLTRLAPSIQRIIVP